MSNVGGGGGISSAGYLAALARREEAL